jgi:putative phosphoribosyl transferase
VPLPFADRVEAGRELAETLAPLRGSDAVAVGLVHGGVVVAAAAAEVLDLALGALCVRKVGHPLQPEYALGAVAPGGIVFIQDPDDPDVTPAELARAIERSRGEAERLEAILGPPPAVTGRACTLVDVGLATGATMVAAARWARAAGARRTLAAVPVAAGDRLAVLRGDVDEALSLASPYPFRGVGRWYRDFAPVSDEEVLRLLAAARARTT